MDAYFSHIFDFVCLAFSLALFLGDKLYIGRKLKTNPLYTIQGVSETARREWAAGVMRAGDGILAVQTLRNSTMVASFMASTSTLLALGVLSLSAQAEHVAETWHVLNLVGAASQGMLMIKILALMLDLFFAFFCFSSSIRLYNHVGFMINTCDGSVAEDVKIAFVTAHLNSAAHQFHTGMRAFYFMVPLVFWVFGSVLLILSTAAMIAVVHILDKTPHASSALLPRRPS